ncbi:MAG: hypothetical protein RUMPE_01348 [Eubacteriales bacterium SKADARSKE-1]|nr:hypothetical protein [Eubacteriales bacterium SKADARSKE-1]
MYPQLANATNNNLTGTKIFDVYFTDESGTRVAAQNFGENIEIYLKVPDGWDYDNMKAFYVTTDGSEAYSIVNEVINSVPYVHITTNHFSNYAIVNTGATSTAIATGDSSFTSVCILSSLLFCAGAMLIFLKKKKGNMYR